MTIVDHADVAKCDLEHARCETVKRVAGAILQTHSALLELSDLRPGHATNQLLGNLVSLCTQIHDADTVGEACALRPPCQGSPQDMTPAPI
jgi:nicotianamine synthase